MARPQVIAHRGASASRPENTLAAYALAVEQRADMIEIDLHTTRDGHIVIRHDEHLEGVGCLGEATLEQVRQVDAGQGQHVPTLTEVLDAFGEQISFNLELKQGGQGPYAGMEQAALRCVAAHGLQEGTLFSSFFDPILKTLRSLSATVRVALLLSRRFPQGWVARARSVGAEALNPAAPLVDGELVEAAHGEGLRVLPFTVDAPDEMRRMLDLGVDGIFTNYPERLRRIVDEG